MKDERRINLCFNLDDPRQKAAYEYLSGLGREKTSTVVNIVLQTLAADNRWKNEQLEREVRFVERFESIVRQTELNKIADIRKELEEVVKGLDLTPRQASNRPSESSERSDPESSNEMSDDAFAAVMAMMG